MKQSAAEILREYGPFADVDAVHGVTWDGEQVWFATTDKLHALDPDSGHLLRSLDVAGHAGTAFDGRSPRTASRKSTRALANSSPPVRPPAVATTRA